MYLSRLSISRKDMLECRVMDEYDVHQLVYRMFPSESERSFLYFVDYGNHVSGNLYILIQSKEQPADIGIGRLEARKIPSEFYKQSVYQFQVKVNPVSKYNGKVTKIHLRTEEAIEWLCRREDRFGIRFVRDSMDKLSSGVTRMHKTNGNKDISISYVVISGLLEVIDSEKFLMTVVNGIGAHKGLGFGLLQLRPIGGDR